MDKLHFKSKHGIILYDSSQIAGVDHNEDELQNEDDPVLQIKHATQHLVTYSLQRGIKMCGNKGREVALSKMKPLHDRDCFKPINVKDVSKSENCKAIESLLFLVEKKDGRIKARHCANGKPQ